MVGQLHCPSPTREVPVLSLFTKDLCNRRATKMLYKLFQTKIFFWPFGDECELRDAMVCPPMTIILLETWPVFLLASGRWQSPWWHMVSHYQSWTTLTWHWRAIFGLNQDSASPCIFQTLYSTKAYSSVSTVWVLLPYSSVPAYLDYLPSTTHKSSRRDINY